MLTLAVAHALCVCRTFAPVRHDCDARAVERRRGVPIEVPRFDAPLAHALTAVQQPLLPRLDTSFGQLSFSTLLLLIHLFTNCFALMALNL